MNPNLLTQNLHGLQSKNLSVSANKFRFEPIENKCNFRVGLSKVERFVQISLWIN